MKKIRRTKLVYEGQYVAEVDVELIDMNKGWSPYLSLDDAYKLDDIRNALRLGDVKGAAQLARIFTLTPIAV
ncbi:MAG: hypothetical protein U9N47_11205 [Thermodesulfobacteriota bacterium]|nr:hypothetical protein [Thermodesulfobacteriota bacterium]